MLGTEPLLIQLLLLLRSLATLKIELFRARLRSLLVEPRPRRAIALRLR
jgi:hypothetical protein